MTQSVIQLQRFTSHGWSYGMFLVPIGGGGLLVHSPTFLGPKTFEAVERHGHPQILFAPNHFHHLGLSRFRDQYPDAVVMASKRARPRLSEQGHRGLEAVEEQGGALPDGMRFLCCAGTKSGETVLSLPEGAGRTWIVCDAFFNVAGPLSGPRGAAFRLLKTGPGLSVGTTFWFFGLADTKAYLSWLEARLEEEQPTRVLFSHGEPLEGDDVASRLWTLARRRLG